MNPEQMDSVYTIYSLPMAHLNTLFPVGTAIHPHTLNTFPIGLLTSSAAPFTTEHLLLKASEPECSKSQTHRLSMAHLALYGLQVV
jgi:hypothetical protein